MATQSNTDKRSSSGKQPQQSLQDFRIQRKLYLEEIMTPLLKDHHRCGVFSHLGMSEDDFKHVYIKELVDEMYEKMFRHHEPGAN